MKSTIFIIWIVVIAVISKLNLLLNMDNLNKEFQRRRQRMLADKIDVASFMTWFIEDYPGSVKIMKENPDYQDRFRSANYANYTD